MPGGKSKNIDHGDKGEYLAQYLLSFLGLPLPVLRQVDIGIDFYCNISDRTRPLLTFSHPFSIQIKKINEKTGLLSEPISFGGLNTKKTKWKRYEIDWLFNSEIPFFIGIANIHMKSLSIYSTSAVKFVYNEHFDCTKITLSPRFDKNDNSNVNHPKISDIDCTNSLESYGDGKEYIVDLGQPIIELNINNVFIADVLEGQKTLFKTFMDKVEKRNITQRVLGSPFFWWNKNLLNSEIAWYVSSKLDKEKIFEELVPIILPLAIFYSENHMQDDLEKITGTLLMIEKYIPNEIKNGPLKNIFNSK